MSFIYNKTLKKELLKEMERVSKMCNPDRLKWLYEDAQNYYNSMSNTIECINRFPLRCEDGE
jgi:hypothetical protein